MCQKRSNMKKCKTGGSVNLDVRNNAVMAELADLGNKRTEPVQQKRPDTSVSQATSNRMLDPTASIKKALNAASKRK